MYKRAFMKKCHNSAGVNIPATTLYKMKTYLERKENVYKLTLLIRLIPD